MYYEINFTQKIESIRILTTGTISFGALSLEVKEKPIFHQNHLEFKRYNEIHTIPLSKVGCVIEKTGSRHYTKENNYIDTDVF